MSLTVDERKEIAEAWSKVASGCNLSIIAQIGSNSQPDAIALAAHAARLGVNAISAHAPCYFRPSSVDELIEYFVPIADAAGDTPFYFYDIPEMTGVRIPTANFLRKGKRRIPSLAGVKYSNNDLAGLQECLNLEAGAFEVWWGCDEAVVASYALGAKGAVGSTYNLIAPLIHGAIAAFDAGNHDTAREIQLSVVQFVRALSEFGFLAAAKGMMELYGMDCGPVRSPLRRLSEPEMEKAVRYARSFGLPFQNTLRSPNVVSTNGSSERTSVSIPRNSSGDEVSSLRS
jgi:N-acetylneuraminate lyase